MDDAEWLAQELVFKGESQIAAELGCNRKTVSAARRDHGIAPSAPGRRRGARPAGPLTSANATERDHATETETLFLERFRRESRPGGPSPSEDLLVNRLRAAHEARRCADDTGYDAELVGIATAAMLIYEHRQQLRRAG